jgi:hypothetical protein
MPGAVSGPRFQPHFPHEHAEVTKRDWLKPLRSPGRDEDEQPIGFR